MAPDLRLCRGPIGLRLALLDSTRGDRRFAVKRTVHDRTYWMRVILCGFVAGCVWYLLSALSLSLLAQDLVGFVQAGGSYPRWNGALLYAMDLMMGIWAVWLYSAIAPRYGARTRTAAIAGLAWWIIKSLQSAKWAGTGLIPARVVLIPLATTLLAAVVASVVGAWIYDRVDRPAAEGQEPTR